VSTHGTIGRVWAALGDAAVAVVPAGPDTWTIRGSGPDGALHTRARLEHGWLALTAATGQHTDKASAWNVLERNAALAGGVRLVLAAGGGLALRADVPLDDEGGDEGAAARHVRDALAALVVASHGTMNAPSGTINAASGVTLVSAMGSPLAPAVLAQSRASGWPVEARGDAALTVDLGVPGWIERAVVTARGDGTLAVTVPLGEDAPRGATETSRRAVARLALRLAGLVRLVRTAADPSDLGNLGDRGSLRFEVIVGAPTGTALGHAFAALAVACALGAAEMTALLHDEAVARLYLQHHHDAAMPQAA